MTNSDIRMSVIDSRMAGIKIEKIISVIATSFGILCLILGFWNVMLFLCAYFLLNIGNALRLEAKADEERITIYTEENDEVAE